MDRDKLIKGIQECDLNGGLFGNCPYKGIIFLLEEQEQMYYTLEHDWRMCRELLKEREAVEPTINEYGEAYCICGENVGIIPNNKNLPSVRTKYCSECGRRMKWK